MSANFDREYRLAAGKAGGMGFEIGEKSKSQPVPLHINFSIERTDLETQNTGRVTVWNLNKEHLATLDEKDCVLSLKAGYGSRMPLIFAGIVTNCVTTHDGDVLDELVWRHYGRSEVIPAVLAANPQLAQLPPVLEAGLVVELPDLPLPVEAPVIRLWS